MTPTSNHDHLNAMTCDKVKVKETVFCSFASFLVFCNAQVFEGLAALTISAVICHLATCIATALGAPGQSITIITALTGKTCMDIDYVLEGDGRTPHD